MRRSLLMCLSALTLLAACRTERTLTEQRRQAPLASPGEISGFKLNALNVGDLPAAGQCDTIERSLDQFASVQGQLVSFASATRRITVGVGADSRIVFYNDVHKGPNAEWVLVDRRFDDGMAMSMRAGGRPRHVHGHADDFMSAPGLGSPTQVARRVLAACRAMLTTDK
jgi:hypothetical protein